MRRPHRLSRRFAALAPASLLAALVPAACTHSGGGGGHHPVPVTYESEPNDTVEHPDFVGTLRPGALFRIKGDVSELGPDVFDGFAFHVAEPCTLEIVLDAHAPADLDLCAVDPWDGSVVTCWESPYDPEIAWLDAPWSGEDVHLVVSSFSGDAPYTLTVRAHAPAWSALAASADAEPELAPAGGDAASVDGARAPASSGAAPAPARGGLARWAGYLEGSAPRAGAALAPPVAGVVLELDAKGHVVRTGVVLARDAERGAP